MGNTGSAHNLNNECVDSELNSYYTQQYLRRTTEEKNKKYVLGGWTSGRNVVDCKVLPKPTENLKLRATTNGAILQAGGTISFRTKEQLGEKVLECEKEITTFQPMRRCHTLILDGQNESTAHRQSVPTLPEFRRSQTLLHVGYNKTKFQEDISTNFPDQKKRSPQSPSDTSTASTLKVNKYNKKRKAPLAPPKSSSGVDTTSLDKNLSAESKSISLAKPRIYATNSNKTAVPQLQQQIRKQQSQPPMTTPFQRDTNNRISANSPRTIQHSSSIYASKLPYRREKSFDAVLLRQKEIADFNDKRASVQNSNMFQHRELPNKKENAHYSADGDTERKKLIRKPANVTLNKVSSSSNITHHSVKNYPQEKETIEERNRREEPKHIHNWSSHTKKESTNHENIPACRNTTNERKHKTQQSRIPQLKRTFYFGMEEPNKTTNPDNLQVQKDQCKSKEVSEEGEDIVLLSPNIEAEEEIVDNGILVHVRPTLPRRQPKTPSFSPAVAWRNLLEEEQRLKYERSKPKENSLNSRVIESPICLIPNSKKKTPLIAANWTPQQDLEDEDDDDEEMDEIEQKCKTTKLSDKTEIEPEEHANSKPLHIFSLSLPRDVHLQCQIKSTMDSTEQENSLRASNCWLVPGFNSLQKFKTQLGKSIDCRSNIKCTCAAKAANKRNSYHLQTIFTETFTGDSKSHLPDCELYKTSLRSPSYHNDNWVLHKSKNNDTSLLAISKNADDNCLKSSLHSQSLSYLQPKSLTNICGGKHIVYLPGQEAFNAVNKNTNKHLQKQTKATRSTYKRQRQRQEIIRENLQDLSPIQNIHQSHAAMPEKNTHRFSFQSTVRVLEKRRLAEKLSKDAEIQEAQRLHELDAMKRVEEDFQRKRAPEKANLRNQLRLHLKANTENEEYRSLPLNINERYNNQHSQNHLVSDVNNNLFCRAEPDGAVSPTLDFKDSLDKTKHLNFPLTPTKHSKQLQRFDSDGDETESETQIPDLQRTALLIEPYLHSII